MKYPHGRIVVFAKAPLAGQVKTRIAVDTSAAAARDFYCAMLEYTVRTVTGAEVADVALYAYPNSDAPYFEKLARLYPISLHAQKGKELGERMANAIAQQLDGADFVLLIGSDCPLIDGQYLDQAAAQLVDDVDVVFGPADDGGYVMVGMRRLHRKIFEGISWSTEQVMAQTRAQCQQLGIVWKEQQSVFDIDTISDWRRLQNEYPEIASQIRYDW